MVAWGVMVEVVVANKIVLYCVLSVPALGCFFLVLSSDWDWDLGPGTWDLGPGTRDLGPRT